MKRLGRWLFNLAAVVSLLLCALTLIMQVRSDTKLDAIWWGTSPDSSRQRIQRYWEILSARDRVWITLSGSRPQHSLAQTEPFYSSIIDGAVFTEIPDGTFDFRPGGVSKDWFGLQWIEYPATLNTEPPFFKSLGVPYLSLTALTSLLPLMCVFRFISSTLRQARVRERRSTELCPICGYDLRATPERCPECGAVPDATEARRA